MTMMALTRESAQAAAVIKALKGVPLTSTEKKLLVVRGGGAKQQQQQLLWNCISKYIRVTKPLRTYIAWNRPYGLSRDIAVKHYSVAEQYAALHREDEQLSDQIDSLHRDGVLEQMDLMDRHGLYMCYLRLAEYLVQDQRGGGDVQDQNQRRRRRHEYELQNLAMSKVGHCRAAVVLGNMILSKIAALH